VFRVFVFPGVRRDRRKQRPVLVRERGVAMLAARIKRRRNRHQPRPRTPLDPSRDHRWFGNYVGLRPTQATGTPFASSS
jgi:hypothetical protein